MANRYLDQLCIQILRKHDQSKARVESVCSLCCLLFSHICLYYFSLLLYKSCLFRCLFIYIVQLKLIKFRQGKAKTTENGSLILLSFYGKHQILLFLCDTWELAGVHILRKLGNVCFEFWFYFSFLQKQSLCFFTSSLSLITI